MRDLAGDHVDLVGAGHRDQHVGIFAAGLTQNVGVGRGTDHRPDVETVLQFAQPLLVDIHDRDVVLFIGQMFGQRTADLTGTQNNNFHAKPSRKYGVPPASLPGAGKSGRTPPGAEISA